LTDTLKASAASAAKTLSMNPSDSWTRSIAQRLDEIASHNGPGFEIAIRHKLSLADANHIQSYVNFLRAIASNWSDATEQYAAAIAKEYSERVSSFELVRDAIVGLVSHSWRPSGR
jgi:hypothetical protein